MCLLERLYPLKTYLAKVVCSAKKKGLEPFQTVAIILENPGGGALQAVSKFPLCRFPQANIPQILPSSAQAPAKLS